MLDGKSDLLSFNEKRIFEHDRDEEPFTRLQSANGDKNVAKMDAIQKQLKLTRQDGSFNKK